MGVVPDNALRNLEDAVEFEPEVFFKHTEENIEKLARMGKETVKVLFENDRLKGIK